MKNIINKIGVFTLACFAFTSCETEDDNTGASLLDYSPATITLSSSSPTTFDESAIDADVASTYQIEVTATLASSQPVDAVIDLVQTGGSASASDFSAHTITIPAGSLTASATVDILQTGDIEGSETLEISGKSRANFNVSPFTFNATIENDYINDHLDLTLSWDGSAEDGDLSIMSFCDMDFDLVLYDESFTALGYVLGSSACPEEDYLNGLSDGTYYLVSELYANPYSDLGFTDVVPLTLSWSQEHFDTSGSLSSDTTTLSTAAGDQGALIVVLEVTNGYNYTLSPFQ
ncbi:MAG: hypothetical protein ABJM36_10035 [Algibacter sp.]|uniref:hypothetical protein n=1 Tax=Algibacter sp. TaxID=1872428 RepID=UPI003297F19D